MDFSKVSCVIFDMDGVIINSEEIHKRAYFDTFAFLNLEVSVALYQSFTGSSTLNVFQKVVSHFKLSEDPKKLVLEKRKRFVEYFEKDPNLDLVPGVKDIIQYFHKKGLTLILASSSSMENIDRVFNRFELNQFFKAKISGADLVKSKPHPEIFEKAAILGNAAKQNCIVIEDSDNGIMAANKAGIYVFGYDNPTITNQTLQRADQVISDYSELKALI